MLRTIRQKIFPNPFNRLLKFAALKRKKKILIEWNRGLGDIPLGLYAMVFQIRKVIPDAKITFLTREALQQGFTFLEGVDTLVAPFWERHAPYNTIDALERLNIRSDSFDLIIEKPDPTYWVKWQVGNLVPKLKWEKMHDTLFQKFSLDSKDRYVAIQPLIETNYNLHRNWPLENWDKLIQTLIKKERKIILLGMKKTRHFSCPDLIDLRGKTNLFEAISILKNCCDYFITPDTGLLAFIYYLDVQFALTVISFWSDARQGILKQNVPSPNRLLKHIPLKGKHKNLSTLSIENVLTFFEKKHVGISSL